MIGKMYKYFLIHKCNELNQRLYIYRNRMKKDFFSSKLCSFYNECITSAIYFPSISQENLF